MSYAASCRTRHVPIASADKAMEVNQLVFEGSMLGLVEFRDFRQSFLGWDVPHGFSPFFISSYE
jgi:hypothetical protein